MLQNNLDPEFAERHDDLVVYGGTGRAARSRDAFDAMTRTLTTLASGREAWVYAAAGEIPGRGQ